MEKLSLPVLLVTLAALTACAPGHADRPDGRPGGPGSGSGLGPGGGDDRGPRPGGAGPLVERTTAVDQAGIVAARLQRGYLEVGRARFERKTERNDARAIDQGRSFGADLVVIVDPNEAGPVAAGLPTPPSIAAPATGAAKSSTAGVEHRGAYAALYFVRHDFALGALARDLTDQERRDAGTTGAIVETVVDGSPASRAGILPGDVVLAVDGRPVDNLWRFNDLVDRLGGPEATLDLVRQGRRFQQTLKIHQPDPNAGPGLDPEPERLAPAARGSGVRRTRVLAPGVGADVERHALR